MIVAGEASGDAHAAKLCRAILDETDQDRVAFFGSAGPKMREAGVEAIVMADQLSIVGLIEIGKALPMFWNAFKKLKNAAIEKKPDVVILVDFPEFNLKLAKSLKKLGFKVVYYISPQMWAWRGYRIKTIKKFVDLLLTILPFENDWYKERGVDHVEFVGNPLANEVHPKLNKAQFCEKYGIKTDSPVIALLPGSRHKEISRILPELFKTAVIMARKAPDIQFVVALAGSKNMPEVESAFNKIGADAEIIRSKIKVVVGETYDVLNVADAAAVTSGTATLETGILGTPMAIVYKTSAINYNLIRPLINVEHFGLVNLIAGERLVNEYIHADLTPEILSKELFRILEPTENALIRQKLARVKEKLGHGGTSKKAAQAIVKLLN